MNIDSSYELPEGRKRVEVVTSVERRRRWAPSQLFAWKKQMEAGALTAVGSEERVVPESELKAAHDRIKRLERLLGQKTEEVEVLKEAVKIGREKKLISRKPLPGFEDFE